jgi:hypothetical protein
MQTIQITSATGTSPFSIDICDITYTYCYNVATGVVSFPTTVTIPSALDGVGQVLVKIVDSNGCETFNVFNCPTNTPTPTPTYTPTPTNIVTDCYCLTFDNSFSPTDETYEYTDCDGVYMKGTIYAYTILYVCGKSPSSTGSVIITIGSDCSKGSCPSPTQTVTPTISVTPSVTPTVSITATITPTNTQTPTNTPTVSITPTHTITPTPSPTTEVPMSYLFIEPSSGSSFIGEWMTGYSSTFYGFTNGSQPSPIALTFQTDMSAYVNFTGWTNGMFPSIKKQTVPQTSGGLDSFGNPIVSYNFYTTVVSANTINSKSWYTWLIPTSLTNNQYQLEIELSVVNPNILTSLLMEPTIYTNTFTYTGPVIANTTYRVYTTYPSSNFELLDSSNIYFKGSVVGP